jgi:hypothetical protein
MLDINVGGYRMEQQLFCLQPYGTNRMFFSEQPPIFLGRELHWNEESHWREKAPN